LDVPVAQLLDFGVFPVLDTDSSIGVGWKLNFYASGTTTRLNTYPTQADALAATNPNANPVVIGSDGRLPPIWLTATAKGVLTDENDVVKATVDPLGAPIAADQIGFSHALTYPSGTVGATLKRFVSVTDAPYSAVGDGTTDDTAAIQAAITALVATGGSVVFPRGRYKITSTLTVSSLYPISLVGEMFGNVVDDALPALVPGAAMAAMVKYVAPDSGNRGQHGAGAVRGLAFFDATHATAGTPGTYTISAGALYLKDFSLGIVENCSFHYIKGSAIFTDYAVMTTVKGCRIRYCGDTANPTRSVVNCVGTSSTYPTQSFLLDDTRIEVCHSTYYVSAVTECYDVTVRGCKFEAATTEYPTSNKTFLQIGATRYLVDGCTFNRNNAVAVIASNRGKLVGCHFVNGTDNTTVTSLQLTGSRIIVANCIFEDNRAAGYSIEVTGIQNLINGNEFYVSGGVYITGRGNVFSNNVINSPSMAATGDTTYWLTLGGTYAVCNGNRFDDTGATLGINGIRSIGQDLVSSNMFDRWAAKTCIRRESTVSVIYGNMFIAVGTAYSESVSAAATVGFTVDGSPTLAKQQAAIADLTSAATAGSLPTPNGAITVANSEG
jgi:hypothetical protein